MTMNGQSRGEAMAVSFADDISRLFTEGDLICMSGFGVLLDSYAFMSDPAGSVEFADHANARNVLKRLLPEAGRRRMPKDGPYWSDEQVALFRQWMDEGFAA